ncbi:MAG: hypothetical protein NZM33_15655 [Bryobacteraceae bacterium]|nr:hypothetical protein [Bryobacteraceae bacterium]
MRSYASVALLCCLLPLQAQQPTAPQPSPAMERAIAEFKAQTQALGLRAGAEQQGPRDGRAGRRWHGRIFENFRNDFLDAVPHEIVQRGGKKALLRRNQFGLNLSGPLWVPRLVDGRRSGTYFSFSYEGVRERISRTLLTTIPTLPERGGDWSAVVDQAGQPLPIFDPLTTRANPAFDASAPVSRRNLQYLREPFPENRIPVSRLDPVAQRALAYYPAPNTAVGPFFRNNYFVVSPETNRANGILARADHSVRERHKLSGSFSWSNGFLGAPRWFPNAANPGTPDRQFYTRRASLEHVFTRSAQTVNTLSFEAETTGSRSGEEQQAEDVARIGLRGVGSGAFPVFRFTPYLSMGRPFPISRTVRNTFTWTDALSTRRGRHSLRITARYARHQVNSYWPQYPAGSFRFGAGLTSLPGIVNTGHAFASFLLGLAEFAETSLVTAPSYFRRSSVRLSNRHQYDAANHIQLTFGLTLACDTPRTEKFDRQSTVDLSAVNPANGRPGALVVAARERRAFQPVLVKLEPSASLAWSPNGDSRTVVRLRWERDYGVIPLYSGQWATQAFNPAPTFVSPNVQLAPAVELARGLPPPLFPPPDLRPEAANDTVADLMDASDRQPTYQSASVSAERELPGAMLLTVGAAYSGGKNMLTGNASANPNAIPVEALRFRDRLNDEAFNRSLRPYPQYKGFDVNGLWPLGRYQRAAGYVRVEKRATHGLTLNLYVELSKQMDDYSGPYGRQEFYNRYNEWSLTAWNRPWQFSLTYTYEPPLGPGRALFAFSDWRRHLVEGWAISGISSILGGEPLALRPQFNNTGGVVTALRVNVVPGVDPRVPEPGPERWFNPAAFDQPPDFTLGNGPRTHPVLRAPRFQNHDLALNKRFALSPERTLEISAVGLNFLNHGNWNEPDTVIGPASAPNVNAGKIIGSRGGRVIQLGLRFSF